MCLVLSASARLIMQDAVMLSMIKNKTNKKIEHIISSK